MRARELLLPMRIRARDRILLRATRLRFAQRVPAGRPPAGQIAHRPRMRAPLRRLRRLGQLEQLLQCIRQPAAQVLELFFIQTLAEAAADAARVFDGESEPDTFARGDTLVEALEVVVGSP